MDKILKPYRLAGISGILICLYVVGYLLYVSFYYENLYSLRTLGLLLTLPQMLFAILAVPVIGYLFWSALQCSKQHEGDCSSFVFSGALVAVFQVVWIVLLNNGFIISN